METDMNFLKDNTLKFVLTARSMWSDNVSQRSSFPDETYYSLEEAQKKCREFRRGLASHMIAGIEEVRDLPGARPVKTGSYWELHMGQFEKTPDVRTLRDWPADQSITQYLKVGDMVDNAMYEHFLNILPPQYHSGGVLQVGGACDAVKNEDGVLKNTYLTFAKRSESDCWVFKGECFSSEWINRNPDLEPNKDLSLSEVSTEDLQKMQSEAFSAYYAEATKPCGNWSPDMKFDKLEVATKRLNEINEELERRMANNTDEKRYDFKLGDTFVMNNKVWEIVDICYEDNEHPYDCYPKDICEKGREIAAQENEILNEILHCDFDSYRIELSNDDITRCKKKIGLAVQIEQADTVKASAQEKAPVKQAEKER